ncbi:MAG: minor capsid protein [Deltaproteobacteria bacterium]|nr:minor capsid protein [Deltaproteobacteria bacterium]
MEILNLAKIGGVDKVVAAQYSAVLDERTCALCEQLDGQVMDINDPDFDRFQPPQHISCRCLFVFIRSTERGFGTPEERREKINWKTPSERLLKQYATGKATIEEVIKDIGQKVAPALNKIVVAKMKAAIAAAYIEQNKSLPENWDEMTDRQIFALYRKVKGK